MVGKDERSYLAHNGILSVIEDNKDDMSDTRIFAQDLLPFIGGVRSLDNNQVWNMLEDFTTGSKIAILTVNPSAKHELYLLHEEKGMLDESGVWWSNDTCYLTSWQSAYNNTLAKPYSNPYQTTFDEEETFLECTVCEAVFEYWEAMKTGTDSWCNVCGSCFECKSYKSACMCYVPSKSYDYRTKEGVPSWGW